MLRLLVDFLAGIIRVLAAFCIIGGAVTGYFQASTLQVEPWAGALIGFAAGFLTASVGAGLLACLILIENHLRILADAQIMLQRQEAARPQAAPPTVHDEAADSTGSISLPARSRRNAGYDPAHGRIVKSDLSGAGAAPATDMGKPN